MRDPKGKPFYDQRLKQDKVGVPDEELPNTIPPVVPVDQKGTKTEQQGSKRVPMGVAGC